MAGILTTPMSSPWAYMPMHRQHNNAVIDPDSDLGISTNLRLAFQHQSWTVMLTLLRQTAVIIMLPRQISKY